MRYYIISIFTIFSFLLNGQGGFRREYKIANALTNAAKDVFENTPNNYIMCGLVVDTVNGFLTNRITLFGINNLGQRTWTKKYGYPKFQYLNNEFMMRRFYKQDNYLYHACCVLDSNNVYQGVFIKFNLNGDTIWQKKFYDANYFVLPSMVTGSIDGGFLITGYFQPIVGGGKSVLLIKTDANGNEIWRKKIPPTGSTVHDGKSIVQDTTSKKIVIIGYQTIGTVLKDNVLICDSLGNKLSQHSYCGSLGAWTYEVIQTKDKKMVMVGRTLYPQTFAGNNLSRSFIVKFDVNSPSVPIWKIDDFDKLDCANTFTSIKELKNEDLLISGVLDTMQQNSLPRQAYQRITKINKNGSVIWNRYYNYSTNTAVDNNHGIMSINLGSNGDWLAAVSVQNTSPDPFFFVRYDSTGCDSTLNYCLSVGIDERKNISESIGVYPNPVKSVINLNFEKLNLPSEDFKYKITDIMDRIIIEEEVRMENKKTTISVNEIKKGVYFLQLLVENQIIATKKFIKE